MELKSEALGSRHDVAIHVTEWDAATAVVDLSVACMFCREPVGVTLTGGLLHLDTALHGVLISLRNSGLFRADLLDTLLIATPPNTIAAKKILVVGLGDPEVWSLKRMTRIAEKALRTAIQLGAESAAFAPGVADSGIPSGITAGLPDALLRGMVAGLDAEYALVGLGLAQAVRLRTWTFDAGAMHFDGAMEGFKSSFEAIRQRYG